MCGFQTAPSFKGIIGNQIARKLGLNHCEGWELHDTIYEWECERSSQIIAHSRLYRKSLEERVGYIADFADLNSAEADILLNTGLQSEQADSMIENAIGTLALPLGIACNFKINGRDYLIPMAVEEPSVLAAVSHAAKLIRAGGGFRTESSDLVMIGQIQLLDVPDMHAAIAALKPIAPCSWTKPTASAKA